MTVQTTVHPLLRHHQKRSRSTFELSKNQSLKTPRNKLEMKNRKGRNRKKKTRKTRTPIFRLHK